MRYVITYINITKEKRYHYVIVILNIDLEFDMFHHYFFMGLHSVAGLSDDFL